MENKMVFLIIIVLIIIIIMIFNFRAINETMINIPKLNKVSWTRSSCDYEMNQTLQNILYNNNLLRIDNDYNIYFPCIYDDIDYEINNIEINNPDTRYFIINGIDSMVGKDKLWMNIVNYYGLDKAAQMIPMTYILDDKNDMERFTNEYDENKSYILKKNIQRQEGLKITNSLTEIMNINSKDPEYVIVQELLQDPYLIEGRKINMRFYVLVICKENNMDVYVHQDGFMYYTRKSFKKDNDIETNITTGYIDREVYERLPLTHEDFRLYLDRNNRTLNKYEIKYKNRGYKLSEIVFSNIYKLLEDVYTCFIGKICGGKLKDNISFQLFGVDIAVNDKLKPHIMEINKGPDMSFKDERDKDVKYKCMSDVLDKIGVVLKDKEYNNRFIQIVDYEGPFVQE